jgi:Domain of unknown function (DUF4145)
MPAIIDEEEAKVVHNGKAPSQYQRPRISLIFCILLANSHTAEKVSQAPGPKNPLQRLSWGTFHELLKVTRDEGSEKFDEDSGVWWVTTHEMFQCHGCKSVVLRRIYEFSEFDHPEVRYFPPPVSRRMPKWLDEIPYEMQTLLNEIYNSLDANTRALPLMGARAILDMVMVDKAGDFGSFGANLRQLETQGFISKKNREVLDAALDAGNAAAHRGYAPNLPDVLAVMDIVENLLQTTYVLDKVAA